MRTPALREGVREVWRDPALLLIEIAWRWTFALVALLVVLLSVLLVLGSTSLNPARLQWLTRLNPWQAAQMLAATLAVVARQLLRVGISATLFLAVCWTCLSAAGRYATLARPAFACKRNLRLCLMISAARAMLAVGTAIVYIGTGFAAGALGAAASRDGMPNPFVVTAILLPALVLLITVWSVTNWYLSLAPLFGEGDWQSAMLKTWNFVWRERDRILEVSIGTGVFRAVLFVIALMLSLAVAAVITDPGVLFADCIAIALLYCSAADFLYVVRLAGYGKVAREAVAGRVTPPGHAVRSAQPLPLDSVVDQS